MHVLPLSLGVDLRRPHVRSRGVPGGFGWMSADSCSPPLVFLARVFWLGRGFGSPGVGGPWLARGGGLQVVESLQTPTSGPRGPTFALDWAAGKAQLEGGFARF